MNGPGMQYATRWNEFVGQARVVDGLKIAAAAAKQRDEPMDHLIFASTEHGIGKTNLAYLAARARGATLHLVQKVDLPAARLAISKMYPGDVLFLDEIQQCRNLDDWLLSILENRQIVTGYGSEDIPPITIMAATTEAHKLSAPLMSRFRQPQFERYTVPEGAKIARLKAKIFFEGMKLPSRRNCEALAQAGNCNPRAINDQVKMLRDMIQLKRVRVMGTVRPESTTATYNLAPLFALSGITPDGLDEQAREYLRVMLTSFSGGPVGIDSLEARLGATKNALASTERVLSDKGLMVRSGSRGRMLTVPLGTVRAEELCAA